MNLVELSTIVQAVTAIATVAISVIAIWLGIRALKATHEALNHERQLVQGAFPGVLSITGMTREKAGIWVLLVDFSQQELALARLVDASLVDAEGKPLYVADNPWEVVKLETTGEEPRLSRPLDSPVLPSVTKGTAVGLFFPLSVEDLEPFRWSPVHGESGFVLPSGVKLRVSWTDALGEHTKFLPTPVFTFKP